MLEGVSDVIWRDFLAPCCADSVMMMMAEVVQIREDVV